MLQRLSQGARSARVLALLCAVAAASFSAYIVQPGDTLSGIAARTGISVPALARANRLADPDRIAVGQRLELVGPALGYTVRAGDTLSGIAGRYGTTFEVVAADNRLRPPYLIVPGQQLRMRRVADGSERAAEQLLVRTARDYGWSEEMVKAVAWQESGWNNEAVSSAGARGIMQVLPSTNRFIEQDLVGRSLNLDNSEDNVQAGVAFLDHLHDLTRGNTRLTLGGYYQGLRSIRINGVKPETRRYIDNVLALRERFGS